MDPVRTEVMELKKELKVNYIRDDYVLAIYEILAIIKMFIIK